MKLTFLGGTGTVTGSKYLLEIQNKKILIDCGLFQGLKILRERNWKPLPFKPESLDAVLLTHAHIDHSGYLPSLVKNGFKGPIYSTHATAELCSILLPDSGYLQETEAFRANKYKYSKHHPAFPLYTRDEAVQALKQFKTVDYDTSYSFFPDCQFSWHRAGHILGAAFIKIKSEAVTACFSGDIGRLNDPIMKPKSSITKADYLILESTYGNRLHEKTNPEDIIGELVKKTILRGGTVLIPSFSVARAQLMLYHLYQLKKNNSIPDVPIFLDSPMSIQATEALLNNQNEHRLSPEECQAVCQIATYIKTPEESIALGEKTTPKIIISASGMLTGGRVLHHLKILLPNPKNSVLLTGFQAPGTRGERLLKQEKSIKIHGEFFPVKAEISVISSLSAHADYEEILLWLKQMKKPPKVIFLTHGTPQASLALKQHIEEELGWPCVIPSYLDSVFLVK
jgi:metallo-beta-lactamase family protein